MSGVPAASMVAVVAAACPELSEDGVSGRADATITSPAVSRDLAVALEAGPGVLRAGAPPVVARLVGELRARGSDLPVPACAICKRSGLDLIRSGTVGLCGRCRAHELAEACSACGRKPCSRRQGQRRRRFVLRLRAPPGQSVRALRAGGAYRPTSQRHRTRHLQ